MNHLQTPVNRMAIMVANGFDYNAIQAPLRQLREEGVQFDLISPEKYFVKAWSTTGKMRIYPVDVRLEDANPDNYELLYLPGGVISSYQLSRNFLALQFATHFFEMRKVIAAAGHSPWMLIQTGKIKGRNLTSCEIIKEDLIKAGAYWQSSKVVCDEGLITAKEVKKDAATFGKLLLKELYVYNYNYRQAV